MAVQLTYKMDNRVKGDTFRSINFTGTQGGTPLDLTGAAIKIEFRYSCTTGSIVYNAEVGSGVTITDAAGGMFSLDEFTPITWEIGTYYYDVRITFSNGDIKTYIKGTVNVLQD